MENNKIALISENEITNFLDSVGLGVSLSDKEKVQFFNICKAYNLNPIKKEIYAVKYGSSPASIIVGFETYIKRAERSGLLDGHETITQGSIKDGDLRAIITIYRKDWTRPFKHEVYYSEYVQKTSSGQVTKFWSEKPITMLKKVAMAQGFRLCFSDELGGLPYTKEEIQEQESIQDVSHVEVDSRVRMNAKQFSSLCERLKNKEDVLNQAKEKFAFTSEQESEIQIILDSLNNGESTIILES